MLPVFLRVILLLILTLGAGFTVNQFYSEGIRWGLLKPRFYNDELNQRIQSISADSAFALHLQGEAFFIDTRPAEEYKIDHIPAAISISLLSYYKSPDILNGLDKQNNYILYCFEPECREANALAVEFVHHRFANVFVLSEGFSEWLERGYPVE
jgi:rhodanese-related sulfurtransferase